MSVASQRGMEALVSLVHDVLDAKIALRDVDAQLPAILDGLPDARTNPALHATLVDFVQELVHDYLIRDQLPLRAEALARIAWRTARAAGMARATLLGLFASSLLLHLDAYEEALALVELIEADARTHDDPMLRATTILRVRCLSQLQRFKDAHRVACEYEAAAPDPRPDVLELNLLRAAADAAASAGEFGIALQRARRAVDVFETDPAAGADDDLMSLMFPAPDASQIYMTLGNALRRAHDHLGAIDAYQHGRAKAIDTKDAVGAAWCLSEIAITWEQLSEFQRAAELLEQAAEEADRAGDHRAAARWRKRHVPDPDGVIDLKGVNGLAAIGEMLRSQGPSDQIEQHLKAIIKAERGTGTTIEPMARNVLAHVYDAMGRRGLALAAVSAAVASADRLNEKWMALSFRCHHAQLLFRQGLWTSADALCDRIFAEADRLLSEARTSEIRQATLAAISVATEVGLVASSHEARHESGEIRRTNPQRVLSIIDRTRGRTFNRWLALGDWSRGTGVADVATATREWIAADIVLEAAADEARPIKPVLDKRAAAEEALKHVAARSGIALPQGPGEGAFPDVSAVLRPGSLALDLVAVESGIVAVCFEAGKPPRTEHFAWERGQRNAWHERWRAAWHAEVKQLRTPPKAHPAVAGAIGEMERVYAELDTAFVQPLVDWLQCKPDHLIVALHAELATIPMWSLARALPDATLSIVPTSRAIALLAARAASAAVEQVAVGDATGSLRMTSRECALLSGYDAIAPNVEDVQRAAPRARRLHFAGHGQFDARHPYSSGLILRGHEHPPYAIASNYAGCIRLTIAGILQLLDVANSELVTLSVCSVGRPRLHPASEFTSVPTALLIAGARNVLAAGWPAHGAATTILMSRFYAALDATRCAASALAIARRALGETTRENAVAILQREDVIPPGRRPFASAIFTDAFIHFGIPRAAAPR